jgi:hypothetical protein
MVFTMAGLVPNSIASVVTPAMSIFFEISLAMVFSLLFPPSLIRFGLVFPRMKRPIESHAALQFFPYAIGLLVFLVFRTGFWLIGYLWMMIALLLTVGLLVHSGLKAHDSVSRAQVRWGILGAVLGLGLFLISYLSIFDLVTGIAGTVLGSFGSLGVAVFGVTLGIAILRYRLFDIDVIIRRTLVYTVMTTVLLAIYFASVVAFQELFQLLTGQHQSSIATVLSTLAIAALFYPLRKRIQSGIDHRFYRRRYNAELTLEAFAATLRDEVDLDQLGNHLVAVIQATMQPESVSLWLRETKKPSPLDRVHG